MKKLRQLFEMEGGHVIVTQCKQKFTGINQGLAYVQTNTF